MTADHYMENDMDAMQQTIEQLKQYRMDAEKTLSQTAEAVALFHTMWDGPAYTALRSSFSADVRELQEVMLLIRAIETELIYARRRYIRNEEDITDKISALRF